MTGHFKSTPQVSSKEQNALPGWPDDWHVLAVSGGRLEWRLAAHPASQDLVMGHQVNSPAHTGFTNWKKM